VAIKLWQKKRRLLFPYSLMGTTKLKIFDSLSQYFGVKKVR